MRMQDIVLTAKRAQKVLEFIFIPSWITDLACYARLGKTNWNHMRTCLVFRGSMRYLC